MAYEGFAEDPDTYRSNGDKYSILGGLRHAARYQPTLSIRLHPTYGSFLRSTGMVDPLDSCHLDAGLP